MYQLQFEKNDILVIIAIIMTTRIKLMNIIIIIDNSLSAPVFPHENLLLYENLKLNKIRIREQSFYITMYAIRS